MVIRRVGALSFAKVAALLYVILGLIFGACLSFFAMTGLFTGGGNSQFPVYFGAGAIVFLPIFYGVGGFIGTLVMASLFNLATGIVGGVEVDAS